MQDLNAATRNKIDSIYVSRDDRFIVSLIVGYSEADLREQHDRNPTAKDAARWALDLTRDAGARGTHWHVYDKKTGHSQFLEQSEFDPEMADVATF